MNIILCGMMGAGKTSVGKAASKFFNLRWVDTDELIENEHGKISEIFAQFGEAHFRELEGEIAARLSEEDGLVISTGGGFILREENILKLKPNGRFIYLRARVETLYRRVEFDDTRPLLRSKEGAYAQLNKRLKARASIYERVADDIIDTDDLTLDETVQKVVEIVKGVI